jgi:molybdopterin synthase catalytic subunit
MRVRVLYFGILRERLGIREETIEIPAGTTAGQITAALSKRHGDLANGVASLRLAVNLEYVDSDKVLAENDEVAVIPPVSGGVDGLFRIVDQAIDLGRLLDAVRDPSAGAIATFLGTTRTTNRGRTVLRLEYEAYGEMAEAELARIGAEAGKRWELTRVSIVHRVGVVPVGEASVAVAVSAPHRAEAIHACHFAIDRLKEVVPIWKKEYFEGGEVWIGSLADCEHDHAHTGVARSTDRRRS